jgi:hypothetical protein
VTASHLTSMHSMDNAYVSKLIPLMAEAELGVVANPLVNLVLQGRQDTYPKRRGTDASARADGRRADGGFWPGLCDGSLVPFGQRQHAGSGPHGRPRCPR